MTSSVSKEGQRSEMSEAEWLTRVELAALYRLTALFGWDQVIYNHISARVPGEPDAFLVNPFGMTFDEIRASDLAKVYADGTTVDGKGLGVNAAGFFLHSVIHEARSDLNCVMHFHSIEVAAVANHPQGLLPICQEAMANFATIAYHDFCGILVDDGERDGLVKDLGDNNIMLLRNHGVLIAGTTMPQGVPPVLPGEEIVQSVARTYARLSGPDLGRREFDAMTRKLDRIDSSYRN